MKKLYKLIIILLTTSILITGCSKNPVDKLESPKISLTYSNLVDKESQKEVRAAMEFVEIPTKNIEAFFREVDDFNNTVKNTTLVESGFITIDSLEPEYDLIKMMDLWNSVYPEFIGYNCRLTTFDLIKDNIKVKESDPDNFDWLIFDLDALTNNPKEIFTQEEYKDFLNYYSYINTEDSQDITLHLKVVQESLKAKKIKFPQNENISIISVYFHDDLGYLFIGHTGILINTSDNKLLFIEKLSYQAPYQAIKFDSQLQLNDYLMNKYDISWDQETAKPFIMENDQLLEGYRENQNNKNNN